MCDGHVANWGINEIDPRTLLRYEEVSQGGMHDLNRLIIILGNSEDGLDCKCCLQNIIRCEPKETSELGDRRLLTKKHDGADNSIEVINTGSCSENLCVKRVEAHV